MDFLNQYKPYIIRAIVGAVVAILLSYAGGVPTWLVGAIIALIAVPASEFAEKQFDSIMEKQKAKSTASASTAKEEAEDVVDAVEEAVDDDKKEG